MKIVQSILARNGLQYADGRPLYAYGVTDAERENLGSFLRMRIAMGGLTPSTAQGFVLWAAEHIRTGFRGGQLTWEFVFEGITLAYDRPAAIELTSRGLDAWGRKLRKSDYGHREFLYTLLAEGGLPDLALDNDSSYRAALLGVVSAIEDEGVLGASIADTAARRQVGNLPEVLRTEEQARLMAKLANAIVDVRNRLPGDLGVENAEGWLDSHYPDWRQALPLRLSQKAFEALVRPVLLSERQREKPTSILVRRQLRKQAGGPWMGVAEIPERAFFPHANLAGVDRSLRLRFTNDTGAGFLGVPAEGGWELIRNAGRGALLMPVAPNEPVFLNAHADGRFLARIVIDAGQPAPDDAPSLWRALDPDTDMPEVLVPLSGRGQTRAGRVFVLAADGLAPECDDDLCVSMDAGGPGGTLWSVTGRGAVRFGSHEMRIVTGADADAPEARIAVLGRPLPGFVMDGGVAAFLGAPMLVGVEGEGPMRPLGSQVRTRVVSGLWGGCVAEWRNSGMVLAMCRYVVLPEKMQIELHEVADGQARLQASGLPEGLHLHLRAGECQQAAVIGVDGSADLSLFVEGRPGTFDIRLSDPRNGETLAMTGLWPSRVARLIDARGARVSGNRQLSRRGMAGWRGVLPTNGTVQLRMALGGTPVAFSAAGSVSLIQFGNVIDQALALQGADGRVNLRLIGGGQETPRLEIGRYDWSAEPAGPFWHLGPGVTRLVAVCLDDPARTVSVEVESRTDPAVWLGEDEGLWFVQGWSESRGVMRPMVWSAQSGGSSSREQRLQNYAADWKRLLSEPDDMGWDRIWSLILAVRDAGDASALDQVQALARVPAAAVALLLRAGRADRAAALLLETESPLWWPLVSCVAWAEAFVSVRDGLRHRLRIAGIGEEDIGPLVVDRLAKAAGEIIALRPELSVHLGQAFARAGERPLALTSTGAPVPLAVPRSRDSLAGAAQEALRRFSRLPDGVAGLSARELQVSLPGTDDFRPLLHAPLVAAEVATGRRSNPTPQEYLQLIALRAADPIWFDVALPSALTLALEMPR
jgi:hypothetical protein